MITSIAWKNIWRNKLRSIVVIVSVAVGVLGGAFFIAIMQGWMEQRMHDSINIETSHIQIHTPMYRDSEKVELNIQNIKAVEQVLDTMSQVRAYSKRTNVLAMATGGYKATGFMLIGVDPENEKEVTELKNCIEDSAGTYFGDLRGRPILLSEKIAKELRIERYLVKPEDISFFKEREWEQADIDSLESVVGEQFRNKSIFMKVLRQKLPSQFLKDNKLTILKKTATYKIGKKIQITIRTLKGHEVTTVFRVVGVYKTSNSMYDNRFAFIRRADLNELIVASDDFSHQIAIMTNGYEQVEPVLEQLQTSFPNLDIQSWRTIQPDMAMYKDMMAFYGVIFMSIILFALGFAIVNTMLMVVLERIKELGMLMAIGMNKSRVFIMIMFETILLCLVGGIAGMGISYVIVTFFNSVGIDISMFAEGMEAFGFAAIIYPALEMEFYIEVTLLVILTGIIAAIYPARKAIKLNPAEAVRTDI